MGPPANPLTGGQADSGTVPYVNLVEAETFGVGKTSYATDCAVQLPQQGFTVGGLLCLASYRGPRWIGQDALLLPGGDFFPFARVDRPDWELRNVFEGYKTRDLKLPPDRVRQHPRLTADRRKLAVNLEAAGRCLDHLKRVVEDASINAVVIDEIGTLLAGEGVRSADTRLQEACEALATARKEVVVATVQIRGQHRQHVKACVDVLKDLRHDAVLDHVVLNGVEPAEVSPRLLELRAS